MSARALNDDEVLTEMNKMVCNRYITTDAHVALQSTKSVERVDAI